MIDKKKFLLYLFFLLFFLNMNVFSQNQIPSGVINSGSGKQSNSDFTIIGTVGEISVDKSSNSIYQTQTGFWNLLTKNNYPSTVQLNATYTFNNVTQTSSYRIIGIPGANNVSIANFMSGSEGKAGDWRAFMDPGSGDYKEYDGTSDFNFTSGNAFWVISKNPVVINRTVYSVPLASDNTYEVVLHDGWNLISNPFEKTVNWNDVKNINSVTQPINYYEAGSFNSSSNNFEPYKGYYFYNTTGLTGLKIPYISGTAGSLPKTNTLHVNELELFLASGQVNKAYVKVGFSAKANLNLDNMDIFSPPSQFCDINISLYNNKLRSNYKYLSEEYRSEIGEGQEYNIIIKNSSGDILNLNYKGLENFSNYEVYLLDNNSMKLYNLKNTDNIEINNSQNSKVFSLFIGTEEYILKQKKNILPAEYSLYQNYPNPFNPTTRIKFALPKKSIVSLKVYNALGELISVLINSRPYDEGYHEITFNGSLLASGVYFCRLIAGNFTSTKKMLILK